MHCYESASVVMIWRLLLYLAITLFCPTRIAKSKQSKQRIADQSSESPNNRSNYNETIPTDVVMDNLSHRIVRTFFVITVLTDMLFWHLIQSFKCIYSYRAPRYSLDASRPSPPSDGKLVRAPGVTFVVSETSCRPGGHWYPV